MSSYNGIAFKIVPENNAYFPQFERNNDGHYQLTADCYVKSHGNLRDLFDLVAIVTVKRPRGTMSAVVHREAGPVTVYPLIYPEYSGSLNTVNAILTSISNVRVFGRPTGGGEMDEQYLCSMTFIATQDPTS